jgi:cysteine synthase A
VISWFQKFAAFKFNLYRYIAGYGTGGTFQGVGRALKSARPDCKIILLEPEAAGLLASVGLYKSNPVDAP